MEKKNTILLTVIAVATLLVAVVGATFAYFTATTTGDSADGEAETGTATSVGGVQLTMTTTTGDADMAYPGGYVVAGASVAAANSDDNNNYTTTFDLNGTITNNTGTALKWYVYEVPAAIDDPIVADSCKRQEDSTTDPGNTRYWYTGCQLADGIDTIGEAIKDGTVPAATGEGLTTPGTATIKVENEVLEPTAGASATTFYYLVVEYPNDASNPQDADQGKTITAKLTTVDGASSVIKAGAGA